MSTPTRLALFAGALVITFGAAWGVGGSVDPLLDEQVPSHSGGTHDGD